MISTQTPQNHPHSLLKSVGTFLRHNLQAWTHQDSVQAWIRQNIVDDDPWDEGTLFFTSSKDKYSMTALKQK